MHSRARIPGQSRLELLPPERIKSIFEYLHIRNEMNQPDLVRPLSQRLLPFSTMYLYHRIKISNRAALENLALTIFSSKSLAEQVVELKFKHSNIKECPPKDYLLRLVEGLLLSLTRMEKLEVIGWDLVTKALMTESFGTRGGRALESLILVDCFKMIEEDLIKAWNNLRNLPALVEVTYYSTHHNPRRRHDTPMIYSAPPGFKNVTTLNISLNFSSSAGHSERFARLFPAVVHLELFHLEISTAPDYSRALDSINTDFTAHVIKTITFNCLELDRTRSTNVQYPIHKPLRRFRHLTSLAFRDNRFFDSELIHFIGTIKTLRELQIHQRCSITFPLLHQFLSGLASSNSLLRFRLELMMRPGRKGVSTKNGALPNIDEISGFLIPEYGWKRPDWKLISLSQARELERLSAEKGVRLNGSIREGLNIEKAFDLEERRLKQVMKFMRSEMADLEY